MFLAALLMPALRNAKDRAKAVVCFNNLREIYAAFAGYASQYDDKYPITGDVYYYLYGTRGQAWWHWLGKGGGFFGQMEEYNGPTFGYNQTRWSVLRCPAEPGSRRIGEKVYGQTYYDSELCGSSYYMNWSISRYCYYIGYCPCETWYNCDPTQYPFRKGFSAGPESGKPAEAWFIMDGPDQGHWWALPSVSWTLDNDEFYPFYHDYSFRHPGERTHFLYLDGHTGTAEPHIRTGKSIWYEIYKTSPP